MTLNEIEKLIHKLWQVDYEITDEEIKDLEKLCYEWGNSLFPISDFYNDIKYNQNPRYNKRRAFQDLYLCVLQYLYLYVRLYGEKRVESEYIKEI